MRKLIWILGAAVCGPSAHASIMFVDGFVPQKSLTVQITFQGTNRFEEVGAMAAHVDGGPMVEAYCVDLFHVGTLFQNYSFTPTSTNLLSNGPRVAHLYNTFAPTIVLGSTYTNTGEVKQASAALQLAIWDVLYDSGDGLLVGNFKADIWGNILTYGNNFLASSGSSVATWAKADAHPNDMNQDLIVPVPEPATIAALGMGAAVLLRRRRR